MDADGISTVDSSLPPEVIAVESVAEEDPVLHSSPPSDGDDHHQSDIRAKIVKQVEYYFSDENLPSDNFLMKQVKKDKEGFGTCDRPPAWMFLLERPIHLWQRRALRRG